MDEREHIHMWQHFNKEEQKCGLCGLTRPYPDGSFIPVDNMETVQHHGPQAEERQAIINRLIDIQARILDQTDTILKSQRSIWLYESTKGEV